MPSTKDIKKYCLYFSSNRLARGMTKMAEEVFKELGFSPTYAYLLMTVNENPNIASKQLSEELFLTQSTLTRLVDKMVYQGYVERACVGRNSFVSLTKKGIEVQPALAKQWIKFHHKYSKLLGYDEAEEFVRTMTKISEKLEG